MDARLGHDASPFASFIKLNQPFSFKMLLTTLQPQEKLAAAFQAKDDGGTGTLATKSDIEETIKDVLPQLEPRQVLALDSLAQQRPDGRWVYEDVYKWGFRTLQEIQNQSILMKSCNKVAVLGK